MYLKDALRIRQESRLDDAGVGSVVTELAIALREDGRIDESDRYFSEAQERSRRVTDDGSEAHAHLLVHLGKLEKLRGHTKQALEYVTEALELMRSLRGPMIRKSAPFSRRCPTSWRGPTTSQALSAPHGKP